MRLAVGELTAEAPFRAGTLLVCGRRLVFTLDRDDLPTDLAGTALRVKWVGGGGEPGETPWECALREAHEEIGVGIDLVPAPCTYLYDLDERELRPVECDDPDPPVLVERVARANPDVADRPGLPAGPYLYATTFLALAGEGSELRRGYDIVGLLLLPPALWPSIESGTTLGEALEHGAEAVGNVPPGTRLWVHPLATIRTAVPLLREAQVAAALGLDP